MLHTKTGSVYRVVLGCFIGVAFAFALAWPQVSKYRNTARAKQAGEFAKKLAAAEEIYKQQTGNYTPDFRLLGVTLDCPIDRTADGPVLDCAEYIYSLQENSFIRAEHKHLPVWLEVAIPNGPVNCQHPPEDWAGSDLCGRLVKI